MEEVFVAQLAMDFPEVKRYKATFKDTLKGAHCNSLHLLHTSSTLGAISSACTKCLSINFALKGQCVTKNTTCKNFMVQLCQLIIER